MDPQVKIDCTESLDKVLDMYKCNLAFMYVFSEHEEVVYMHIDT